jgi:spore coat polysaccharide biosynthesis protein SpsF
MTGVVLQARLDSSRLPGKALLDLKGKTTIFRAMEALRGITSAGRFILATDEGSAELLREQAEAGGFELFIGSKENVLERYAGAVRAFGLDTVVRATGDNPLVSAELAEESIALQQASGADYAALIGAPLGTGVEVVRAQALLAAAAEAAEPYETEHVCPFLYRRPQRFEILTPTVDARRFFPSGRVTLDTLEDYRYIARIFGTLYSGKPIGMDELIRWLRNSSAEGENTEEQDSGYSVGTTG